MFKKWWWLGFAALLFVSCPSGGGTVDSAKFDTATFNTATFQP